MPCSRVRNHKNRVPQRPTNPFPRVFGFFPAIEAIPSTHKVGSSHTIRCAWEEIIFPWDEIRRCINGQGWGRIGGVVTIFTLQTEEFGFMLNPLSGK